MTRRAAAPACTTLLLAVSLGAAGPTADHEAESSPVLRGADPELLATVRDLGPRIAPILRVAQAPAIVALRADAATRAAESRARAERTLPPSSAPARGRAWADLGLGAGQEPAQLAALLEADLDGFTFDRTRARLLVDPARLAVTTGVAEGDDAAALLLATGVAPDEPVAAHYVAHLALDPAGGDPFPTTDALLARAALVEGGANVAALLLLFSGVGLERDVLSGTLRPEDALGGRLVPEAIRSATPVARHLLEFVYLDGFAQAAALAKDGDLRRVASEVTLRRSTRDVLHLDRAPAPAASFPTPAFPSLPSLRLVDRDALGEQGIVSLVALTTGKDNLALIAGDGWVGDAVWRFEGAEGGGGEGVTVWVSRWLTETDAKDAFYALTRSLQARFPGESATEPSADSRILVRPDRVHRLARTGLEVSLRVASRSIDGRIDGPAKKKGTERP